MSSVYPGHLLGLLVPLWFALAFSIMYPTARAGIGFFNTQARILEMKAEERLDRLRLKLNRQKSEDEETIVESVIDMTKSLYAQGVIEENDFDQIKSILREKDRPIDGYSEEGRDY